MYVYCTVYEEVKSIHYEENEFQFTELALRLGRIRAFRKQAGSLASELTKVTIIRALGVKASSRQTAVQRKPP